MTQSDIHQTAPAADGLRALPPPFVATRESLWALACYVVAPARKARSGRIGLRPTGDGFGTPELDDGSRLVVRADHLLQEPGDAITLTTLRAAAAFAGVDLSPEPGVGNDLPPFTPDEDLGIDAGASLALGAWYAFGQGVLDDLRASLAPLPMSEAELWPEHFDLATVIDLTDDIRTNVGFSPGDGFHRDPYLYVGPHDTGRLLGAYWNAPFGAFLGYGELTATPDPRRAAQRFVGEGLRLLSPPGADPHASSSE